MSVQLIIDAAKQATQKHQQAQEAKRAALSTEWKTKADELWVKLQDHIRAILGDTAADQLFANATMLVADPRFCMNKELGELDLLSMPSGSDVSMSFEHRGRTLLFYCSEDVLWLDGAFSNLPAKVKNLVELDSVFQKIDEDAVQFAVSEQKRKAEKQKRELELAAQAEKRREAEKAKQQAEANHWRGKLDAILAEANAQREREKQEDAKESARLLAARTPEMCDLIRAVVPDIAESLLAEARFELDDDGVLVTVGELMIWRASGVGNSNALKIAITFEQNGKTLRTDNLFCDSMQSFAANYQILKDAALNGRAVSSPDYRNLEETHVCMKLQTLITDLTTGRTLSRAGKAVYSMALLLLGDYEDYE